MAGRTANYTEWRIPCSGNFGAAPDGSFLQRDWYLPLSRILVVDEFQTPGLADVLKAATLR